LELRILLHHHLKLEVLLDLFLQVMFQVLPNHLKLEELLDLFLQVMFQVLPNHHKLEELLDLFLQVMFQFLILLLLKPEEDSHYLPIITNSQVSL
jgi:hypothetical protein